MMELNDCPNCGTIRYWDDPTVYASLCQCGSRIAKKDGKMVIVTEAEKSNYLNRPLGW